MQMTHLLEIRDAHKCVFSDKKLNADIFCCLFCGGRTPQDTKFWRAFNIYFPWKLVGVFSSTMSPF